MSENANVNVQMLLVLQYNADLLIKPQVIPAYREGFQGKVQNLEVQSVMHKVCPGRLVLGCLWAL